jgi:hypothetical protein
MIFLKKEKKNILNWWFYNIKLKYKNINLLKLIYNFFKIIYFKGKNGFFKLIIHRILDIHYLKEKFNNLKISLNTGYMGYLYLNGIGFKCTKKIYNLNKRFWRFNVGHSQVFLYYTPKDIIMKVKQRFLCFFGIRKNQIFDITSKIKNFHIPDSYKGVGIKYPDEFIILKKGKTRQ